MFLVVASRSNNLTHCQGFTSAGPEICDCGSFRGTPVFKDQSFCSKMIAEQATLSFVEDLCMLHCITEVFMTAKYHAVAYQTRHQPQPRRHVVKSLQ